MEKIVVIGGGLAGLSGGFHLQEFEPLIFEKEDRIGGICRSFVQDGFTFDVTGHLIHLKDPYTRELIDTILPDTLARMDRKAAIYSKATLTPYPFQANTHGLPPEVVKECLLGFIDSIGSIPASSDSFEEWALKTFGTGIARHFMLPYNEKFWKTDLSGITSDWVSWAIPKPSLEEVVNGALGLTNEGLGYNPSFSYPKSGGIDCLPNALAAPLGGIHTGCRLESIDARNKVVRFAGGHEETYDYLLTTIPLPMVYRLLDDPPDDLAEAAGRLRAVSVLDINLGVDRPNLSEKHWIYFPEGEFVFSRVGFPANFSAAVAPEGTSSMYVEITHAPGDRLDIEQTSQRAVEDLEKCGILSPGDRILTRHVIDIPCAYVIFDTHRQTHLDKLTRYLESLDIFTAGRYGKWDYYSMEDSILSGKGAAEGIRKLIRGKRLTSR
jgi:protoporphyrinogen oxidase